MMHMEARTVGEMSRKFILKTYQGSLACGVCIVAAVAVLAGCSTYDSVTQRIAQRITPYRITIVQGNFVSQEAAAKMHVGMTRVEVSTTLGTPLLTDMFHADRWDYVFYFKRGSASVVQQRDFVVHFKDDRVVSWEGGDDLPSEIELLAEIDGDRHGKMVKASAAAASAAAATGASAAVAAGASAAVATGASAPVAAEASAPASASDVPAVDPNEQAAQAANRAVNQAPSSSGSTPSVRSGAPVPGAPASAVPQFQFHRQPQPASPNQSEPVGPAGSQSSNESSPNQPATSAEGSGQNTGG
jgi:outer membrane protein assembly factor BamE